MGPSRIGILEKIFAILNQMGDSLEFFLRNKALFTASTGIKHILACAYADMVSFITEVGIHYTKMNTSKDCYNRCCFTLLTSDYQVFTSHFSWVSSTRALVEESIRSSITKILSPMKYGLLP